jgi:hypothetical protein
MQRILEPLCVESAVLGGGEAALYTVLKIKWNRAVRRVRQGPIPRCSWQRFVVTVWMYAMLMEFCVDFGAYHAANPLIVLAIMAVLNATLTLPGIAGLILQLAMGIDANVIIFERIREEREAYLAEIRGSTEKPDKFLENELNLFSRRGILVTAPSSIELRVSFFVPYL